MNWTITYPRKLVSLKDKIVREEEKETGYDLDDLLFLVKKAYEDQEEISIELDCYDPTPQYLYDEYGGEPPISADERWTAAFNQKRELKS